MAGAGIVLIADQDWANGRLVKVADVSCSWEASRAAPFSCFLPARTAHALGWGNDLRGKWLFFHDPYSGGWGGIITDAPSESGVLEVSAQTFHVLLHGRRTEPTWRVPAATPGGIARRLLWNAHTSARLPFATIAADEAGVMMDVAIRGESVGSLLERVAEESGHWFDITVSATRQLGFVWRGNARDRTGEILIAEGYHPTTIRIEPTLQGLSNSVLAIGTDRTFYRAFRSEAFDGDSIRDRGLWQSTIEVPTVKTRSLLKAHARRVLARTADPPMVGTVTLPSSSLWVARIRCGDTIRLRSSSANRETAFTVAVRSLQANAGTVTYTGLCVPL